MNCEYEPMVNCSENVPTKLMKSEYRVDIVNEVQKYWMVGGVLLSVACAVLAPHVGAPGGVLRTQYLWYLPLCYVWYNAGRRGAALPPRGALLVAALHAALVVPALRLLLPLDDYHHGVAVEGGWSWLSVALCEDEAAAAVTVVAAAAVLGTGPLGSLALCGRAALPTLGAALGAGAPAAGAWCAGVVRGGGAGGGRGPRVAALLLVYVQCCGALAARGPWAPGALLGALAAEAGWAGAGAGLCGAYARLGLGARGASLAALCALPRALEAGGWCGGAAAGPAAALRAPAAALLLAALAPHHARRR